MIGQRQWILFGGVGVAAGIALLVTARRRG